MADDDLSGAAVLKTLLVSDLVASTRLVERLGDARSFELFTRHDRVARDLLQEHDGLEVDKTDGFLLLFERPVDAVRYAVAYHQALVDLSRWVGTEVASRVGIHLGEVYLRRNPAEDVARGAKPLEVEGLAKPMAARLMTLATGGQTLLTRAAFDLARRAAVGAEGDESRLQWLAHGNYLLKGVEEPIPVFEVGVEGMAPLAPPPDSEKVRRVVGDETVLGWRPAPGQSVPHRPNWALVRKLGEGGFGEVWLAAHTKTGDERVLKFCFDAERLRGLQREVTLFRLLKEALGNREDIARILDWSFEEPPYFVESEFTEGGSLSDWAQRHGGVDSLSLPQRLEVVAQVADALAAAHSVGVLHKDLKPANVLLDVRRDGSFQGRLTDFGIGLVVDRDRLAGAGFTILGFTETMVAGQTAMSGTQLYMAPELLEGKPPTVQADVYALGVMLYQLVVADLHRALAPGWERDVADPLLREDIASLVDGSPERRLADAAEAARRLRQLEDRRAQREAEARAQAEAEATRLALDRARRRRKLVTAVVASLAVFAAAMAVQSVRVARAAARAEREAVRATQEAEKARRVRDFLVDLWDGARPERARGEEISARRLLDDGAAAVDRDLADQPLLRADMTGTLGEIYFKLGDYDRAETFFTTSADLLRQSPDHDPLGLATSLMNLATIHATRGRLAEARPLLEEAAALYEHLLGPDHDRVAAALSNLASFDYMEGHVERALAGWKRARDAYERAAEPRTGSLVKVLNNVARAESELGRFDEAQASLERALELLRARDGANHPEEARLLANLAQVAMARERLAEAEALSRQALELRERVLGGAHPLVAASLCNLAEVLLRRGDPTGADPLLTRAQTITEAAVGPDHPLMVDVLLPSAEAARLTGRTERADQLLAQVTTVLERRPNPAAQARTVAALARVRRDQGRPDEARDLYRRALAAEESARGADHPVVTMLRAELEDLGP